MAKGKRPPFKTIFFIAGPAATEEEDAEASKIEGQVVFRNVRHIADDGTLEDFDAVAGLVPPRYAEAAADKAAEGDTRPPEPKATAEAPAAPQKAAVPGKPAGSAWGANS